MIPYQVKSKKISGANLGEVMRGASVVFKEIKRHTKRRPYVRSAYFKKEKVFFDYFWKHLNQKPPKIRFQRMKYFKASIELIQNSKNKPDIKKNPNRSNEIFYRFAGLTAEGEIFFVQIKESKKEQRFFMSCFSTEYFPSG